MTHAAYPVNRPASAKLARSMSLMRVCKRVADASACFKVGDKALYFGDGDEYGTHATIVGGYQMRAVTGAGPYVAADGKRLSYRPGYAIECKNERFFCPAHAITRGDCRPSHLRLVEVQP